MYQVLLVAATSAVFLVMFDRASAGGVWSGGGVAAFNAWLASRCARRDRLAAMRSPPQSLAAVYICMVQRFVVVAAGFALLMGATGFPPLAVLTGFLAGQLVLVIVGTQQLTRVN